MLKIVTFRFDPHSGEIEVDGIPVSPIEAQGYFIDIPAELCDVNTAFQVLVLKEFDVDKALEYYVILEGGGVLNEN